MNNPDRTELKPALMDAAPNEAPTVRSSRIFNGAGSAPDNKIFTKSSASSTLSRPEIVELPPEIFV